MSFQELGINETICEGIERMKWKIPTDIQKLVIPEALNGRDIIALAKTGSGKTGAFTIPIVQGLFRNKQPFYAVILTPTRDLAIQIQTELKALGKCLGLKCALVIGGDDMKKQSALLQNEPHVVISTPGRFLKHIESTRGFNQITLKCVKLLVLDEADKMLGAQFERDMEKILYIIPQTRQTLLFSATNTDKNSKLHKVRLKNPAKIEVNEKFTQSSLLVEYMFMYPNSERDLYFAWLLRIITGMTPILDSTTPNIFFTELDLYNSSPDGKRKISIIVFVNTKELSNLLSLFIRRLGMSVVCINGDMSQEKRNSALNSMKMKKVDIIIATDVISRGIDISAIDVVINYDMPESAKTYVHRIGRAGRAGKKGVAITMFSKAEMTKYTEMSHKLKRKFVVVLKAPEYATYNEQIESEKLNIYEALSESKNSLAKMNKNRGFKRKGFNVEDHQSSKKSKK